MHRCCDGLSPAFIIVLFILLIIILGVCFGSGWY